MNEKTTDTEKNLPKRRGAGCGGMIAFVLITTLLTAAFSGLTAIVSDSFEDLPQSSTAETQITPAVTTPPPTTPLLHTDAVFSVVIDAGHGGSDAGSTDASGNRLEKDDNLDIALLVAAELERAGCDSVTLTRNDDVFVSLDDRCYIANSINADLFVSLHRNCADFGNGVEVWINSDADNDDNLLAGNILKELEEVGINRNRGVRSGYMEDEELDYYVNSNTYMPSCLVELGFISDSSDNRLFDDNLEEYAHAIAEGIILTAEAM